MGALDLLAIGRRAEALGRVADAAELPSQPRCAPGTEPIPTDLSVRDRPPALDPVLAGAVVVVSGTLALQANRSGRRRRWSLRP